MALTDVHYQNITYDYWYAILGDFKLIVDMNTGFYNATRLCASGGKQLDDWTKLRQSKEMISYAASLKQMPVLYSVTSGYCEEIMGTYVSDDLILAISLWVSPHCYTNCHTIVRYPIWKKINRAEFMIDQIDVLKRLLRELERSRVSRRVTTPSQK